MSEPIHIQFTRFSAFYSPLIATMAGGFLRAEGLEPRHSNAPSGTSAIENVVAASRWRCSSTPVTGAGSTSRASARSTWRATRWTRPSARARASLAATRAWLATDMARRFMRAYRKARSWLGTTPAAQVAEAEAPFVPDIDRAVLTATIAYYQTLGCWTPHVEITRPAFEATLDIFQHAGLITRRHAYEAVVAAPPAG